jgi:hypothetical protein
MVVKTRQSAQRPNREERLQNAAQRCRVKKSIEKSIEKAQQEEAFKDLNKMIGANGGKVPHGEMDKLVKSYNNNGFKAVTRQNLYYRLSKLIVLNSDNDMQLMGQTIVTTAESEAVILDITDEQVLFNAMNDTNSTNIGGRRKGSTKEMSREKIITKKNIITQCAMIYEKEVEDERKAGKTSVPYGTLQKIIY